MTGRHQLCELAGFGVSVLACAIGCSVYNADLFDAGSGASGGGSNGGSAGGNEGGSGGTTPNAGGTGGTPSSSGGLGGGAGTQLELIDDMEDGNSTIRLIKKRNGHWDVANSGSGGAQEPASGFTVLEPDSGAPDSDYAAHTAGGGFAWATLNVSMKNGVVAYDASAYRGLSFRAKVGTDSVNTVRVRVVTGDTDPAGGICGNPNPVCYDHFTTEVVLDTDWSTQEVFFDDFSQDVEIYDAVNLETVYYFQFYFEGSADFEIWIDDLSFISK